MFFLFIHALFLKIFQNSCSYERLQYSVYAAIENPALNSLLWNELITLLKEERTAKLYVIPILKKNFRTIKIIGTFDHNLNYLLGEKRSLIF